jgi:hypothetical protein|tara:strand:+ start:129 stop:317 length:189 start_codon:yes stop_codon:yes gene_type:complete
MEIIWVLLLSVCTSQKCVTQEVKEFLSEDKCISSQVAHELIPTDGKWDSIIYKCQPKDSIGA